MEPTRFNEVETAHDAVLPAQAMLTEEVAKADVVITTALIPGRKAPVLIPEAMVAGMKRGSVIVDMASVNGGNVVGTVDGEKVVTKNGVSILGYSDLPSRLPTAASQLFGRNQANFLLSVGPQTTGNKGEFVIDYEDPAVRISASRRVETPSRRRRDSFPGMLEVGGFFLDFEAVRLAAIT